MAFWLGLKGFSRIHLQAPGIYGEDMNPYKKRARAGWCSGKKDKAPSNKSERIYEKTEIRAEEKEHLQGEDFRYKHKKAVKKNEKARLENSIRWYERTMKYWKSVSNDYWLVHSFKSSLEKARKRYKEKYGEDI